MVTGVQIRMARVALGWDAADLERESEVSLATIFRIENGGGAYASTLTKLQAALEAGGAVFIADRQSSPDGGPGVRLQNAGIADVLPGNKAASKGKAARKGAGARKARGK